MPFSLAFDHFIQYDSGISGISIRIELAAERSVSLEAKIDTGATDCVFSRSVGEEIGVNIEKGDPVKFSTATGPFRAFRNEVLLSVLGEQFEASVCFAENPAFNRNVLGRHGFLDRVVLGIVDYEGSLYLKRYGR